MHESQPLHTTRAISMVIATAALVATGMMFVPVAVLESVTGSTGISELIPATGAPLGDFARAVIAFGTGAITLVGLTVLALRQDGHSRNADQWREPQIKDNAQFRSDIIAYLASKMPWHKKPEDIRSLADLARLRSVELSADVPVRRLLVASQDLPQLDVADGFADPGDHLVEFEEPIEPLAPMQDVALVMVEQSTAEMVTQLEAAVVVRHRKLDLLAIAPIEGPSKLSDTHLDGIAAPEMQQLTATDANASRRPVLELVSSASIQDEDADSALAAALATLQRMTANAR